MVPSNGTTAPKMSNRVAPEIYEDANAIGESLADSLLSLIIEAGHEGRKFLLGCPGGRSGKSTFMALARRAAEEHASLCHLIIVMMDEYAQSTADGFEYACTDDAHFSCRRFAFEEIQAVLNEGLSETSRIPKENVWFPDASKPDVYEEMIRAYRGIDYFILASGASDGHVAFNPPGSSSDCGTRVVALAESTRRDNLGTFPGFKSIEEVPLYGVTVGLGTIAELSRRTAMIIHGEHKRAAAAHLAALTDFDPNWPASIIYQCNEPRVLLDRAAAEGMN